MISIPKKSRVGHPLPERVQARDKPPQESRPAEEEEEQFLSAAQLLFRNETGTPALDSDHFAEDARKLDGRVVLRCCIGPGNQRIVVAAYRPMDRKHAHAHASGHSRGVGIPTSCPADNHVFLLEGVDDKRSGTYFAWLRATHSENIARPERRRHAAAANA